MAKDEDHALDVAQQVASLNQREATGYLQVPCETICFQEDTIEFWYKDLDSALDNLKKW